MLLLSCSLLLTSSSFYCSAVQVLALMLPGTAACAWWVTHAKRPEQKPGFEPNDAADEEIPMVTLGGADPTVAEGGGFVDQG